MAHKFWRRRGKMDSNPEALDLRRRTRPGRRHLHLVEILQRVVHRIEVHLHDLLALLSVSLADGILDRVDRLVARQHTGHAEKADLHDGVDAPAHAALARHLAGVDDVEVRLLLLQVTLHFRGQMAPGLVRIPGTVQQEGPAFRQFLRHFVALDELRLVAPDEIRGRDKVGRANRPRPEAQVRDGHRPGLLRVVNEIGLGELPGAVADDFDRFLVRAHRAVCAEPVEHRAEHVLVLRAERRVVIQARVRHVVVDADGEMLLRRSLREIVKHRLDHGRREFLGRKPVAAAKHARQ